jgi:hypothetical protein
MPKVKCMYCKRSMKSEVGLSRHLAQSGYCKRIREQLEHAIKDKEVLDSLLSKDIKSLRSNKPAPAKKRRLLSDNNMGNDEVGQESEEEEEPNTLGFLPWDDGPSDDEEEYQFDVFAETTSEEMTDDDASRTEDSSVSGEDNDLEEAIPAPIDPNIVRRSKRCGQEFKKYVRNAYANFIELSRKEASAIKIMHVLIRKKATLDTYEQVMRWHLEETGDLGRYEPLGRCKHFISREKLMQKLRKRYNMDKKYATPHVTLLPHTNTKVTIWKKLARDNVVSLLTDPRWKDEDWLYFDDDPFAKPPTNLDYVEDLNTGEAYLETYKKLITKPNQILVAIPLYIDGAVTGQYDKLQVTALKMTIGILNRRARDKEFAWKTLGYISNYTKEDSRGKRMFVESGHIAAFELYADGLTDDEDEGANAGKESDVDKAADYHAILEVLLASLKELIEEGMVVDIFHRGKLYKDCELVFFVPFVKCDGDEGDKLCASYRSRGAHVQQLCRYCQCPNAETDNPHADYPFKTEPMLKKLFEQNNVVKLQELSQIPIKNAFHGLRFGLHNNRGIHGACPWELLHAILLGIFKYVRDCFFDQIGPTSAKADDINALAKVIGKLLARQSDRRKPRTQFGKGIYKGKLMAKEYTGVLLVMAAILRCKAGKDHLKSARKKHFKEEWLIRDWILLVETLLQWEAYLNLARMQKKDVHRLKRKHKFLMYLLIKVGNRVSGMGFKVMKVHAMLHLAFDILMFSVPMVVDTGSNESHHKTTKVAAKLTQKDIKTFEKQTSNRMDDFHVLDLAMEELEGRPLWKYFNGYYHEENQQVDKIKKTGGMVFSVFEDEDNPPEVCGRIQTRMQNPENIMFDSQLLQFAMKIQQDIKHLIPRVSICAEHSRDGYMFRSHPNYRGKGPWRDWVMINWEEGDFPAKIWGFVDLSSIPQDMQVDLESIDKIVERGVYAIVESCTYVNEDRLESDIFTPIQMETTMLSAEGEVLERKFYLVDVETFKEPIVVIPDIGASPKCLYLMMAPRSQWADDFMTWIRMPHDIDEAEMAPLQPQQEEEEEDTDEDE